MAPAKLILILLLATASSLFGQCDLAEVAANQPAPAAGGGGGTAWVTSNPSSSPRNNFTGCVGTKLTVGGANIEVSHLGLWVISGNNDMVTVAIKDVNQTTIISSDFDTSGMSPGWNYQAITPTTLTASELYLLTRTVTNGEDQWPDQWVASVTGVTSAHIGTYDDTCNTSMSELGSGEMFGGVNFKYTSP